MVIWYEGTGVFSVLAAWLDGTRVVLTSVDFRQA